MTDVTPKRSLNDTIGSGTNFSMNYPITKIRTPEITVKNMLIFSYFKYEENIFWNQL